MSYHYKYLRGDRWGIYIDNQLVASVGCRDTCIKIIEALEARMSDRDNARRLKLKDTTAYFKSIKLAS